MPDASAARMTALASWQNFYVIMGSSAGALIGLQFVVMSLVSNMAARTDPEAGRAFATPQIVHFTAVLGLAAVLSAPWDKVYAVAMVWGVAGLGGVVYTVLVMRRMRAQDAYQPEFEDWLFHAVLPLSAYLTLAGSAYAALSYLRAALFGVAAAVLLLLFIGIHNAWDAVTYHIFSQRRSDDREQ